MSAPENPIPVPPPIPELPIQVTALPVAVSPGENPSWTIWEVSGLAVITLIAWVGCILGTAYLVHVLFSPIAPWSEALRRPEVIVGGQLLAYFLVVVVMYCMVSVQNNGRVLEATRWNWPRNWGSYLVAGVALALCLVPLQYFLPMPKHPPIDDFFRTERDAYILSVFGVFCAPLFEELFFRGFLYPAVARRLGMVPSILITALLFASIHAMQLSYSWGPLLVMFLVGATLTSVRAVKKSVSAVFLMHMAYNGTIFIAEYVATDGFRHLEKFSH